MESIVKVPDGFMARTILPSSFLFYLKKLTQKLISNGTRRKKAKN